MVRIRLKLVSLGPGFVAMMFGACFIDVASAQQSQAIEEVVVRGIRGSLQQSLERKRQASTVIDSITAQDIGRFPDENIAESLQRVTGITIERDAGEGNRVTIRGLPSEFTRVQFNGRTISSSLTPVGFAVPATRNFDFNALPSEFVSSIDVFKSSMADLQEGGLSGTVSVNTPRPLAIGERRFTASAKGSYESNSEEVSPNLAALYTDVFAEGRFGVTLGAAFSEREREIHGFLSNFWAPRTEAQFGADFNGNGVVGDPVLAETVFAMFQTIDVETRERGSGLGVLEFQATDSLRLYGEALYTRLENKVDSNAFLKRFVGAVPPQNTEILKTAPGSSTQIRVTSLNMQNVDLRGTQRNQDREGDTWSLALGGEFNAGLWDLDVKASYSLSEQDSGTLGIEPRARAEVAFDCAIDEELCSVWFDGNPDQVNASQVPNDFQLLSINGDFGRNFEDENYDLSIDLDRQLDLAFLTSIEAGAFFGRRQQLSNKPSLLINAQQADALFGGLPLVENGIAAGSISAEPFMVEVKPSTKFLGGLDSDAVQATRFLATDTRRVLSQFNDEQLAAAGTVSENPAETVDIEEDIIAGYLKVNFESGNGFVSGNAGVRVVYTDQTARGFAPDLTGIETFPEFGNVTIVPDAGPTTADNSYTEVLPSLNVRFDLREGLVSRFAANRTMTRPTLAQLSPSTTAAVQSQTITQGNPSLDPFVSNNFDVTLEQFFGEGGLVALAGFWKDVRTLIRDSTSETTLTTTTVAGDGTRTPEDVVFVVNRPENADGVKVKGFEFSYQQPFAELLPGLLSHTGIIANYTFVDNTEPETLVGTSKNSFNLQGYYETDRIGVRLAFTWRDEFLVQPDDSLFFDAQFEQSFGTFDANVSYNVTDRVQIVFEAVNLLDEGQFTTEQFGGFVRPRQIVDFGRRVLLGARVQL